MQLRRGRVGLCSTTSKLLARYHCRHRERKKARRDEDGLVTSDGAVFQIDGNLGFLAGVNEMLLQSRFLRR